MYEDHEFNQISIKKTTYPCLGYVVFFMQQNERGLYNMPAKRVDIVSLKLIKENSVMYAERTISDPASAVNLVRDFIANSDREKLIAIYLNTKNEPVAIQTISIGTLDSSLVHPREVFKGVIMANAASFILAHNHPSGNPEPSRDDIEITKRIMDASKIIGISLMDHLIVCDAQYISFKERGLLDKS